MLAESSQQPVSEAVRSLEVRWIFPGRLETAVAAWFARFPATTESREDVYLLDPCLPALSVKLRGGGAMEAKAYRGSPGILQVPGRARGRMQTWQKWPFPGCLPGPGSSWQPVAKRRRISRFPLASGPAAVCGGGPGPHPHPGRHRHPGRHPHPGPHSHPRCEVELTEIRTRGQDWWTLGFEMTGPAELLRSELQATAALVFARALPGDVEPGPDQSSSYAEWLSRCR